MGDFSLTKRIDGFWDRAGVEIDLIALDELNERIRFGTCKRSEDKLVKDVASHQEHVRRFLDTHSRLESWAVENVAIAPRIGDATRSDLRTRGFIPQDLKDLTHGL